MSDRQLKIRGTASIKPPRPKRTDEAIATRAASLLVSRVDVDGFFWETPSDVTAAEVDLYRSIVQGGSAKEIFARLPEQRWGWEYCGELFMEHFPQVMRDCLADARAEWDRRYGDAT